MRAVLPALLAATLAFATVPAAPARADLTTGQALALSAGAIVLLGTVLSRPGQADVAPPQPVTRQPPPRHVSPPPRVIHPQSPRHRRFLPAQCLRVAHTGYERLRYMPARCLRHKGIAVRTLPQACRMIVYGQGPAYNARCLWHRGYRLG